jgi:alanyl-tRNA synthetase
VESVVRNDRGQNVVVGEIVSGRLEETPASVVAEVDEAVRRDTERNHTATHLLHAALRAELGEHVQQAGSLVAPDRLRFDFTHSGPLSEDERRRIEERVNRAIWDNTELEIGHRDYREALGSGAMALFGEKYGDVVRVVSVPDVSLELCGGCHVRSTGQIGLFRITSETGVAAGIRRVEAVTGPGAYARVVRVDEVLGGLARRLRVRASEVERRVESLLEEKATLESRLQDQHGRKAEDVVDAVLATASDLPGGGSLAAASIDLPPGSDLAAFGDMIRERLGSGSAILHVREGDEKAAFIAVVTDDWIGRGLKAGDLVSTASRATGSGGGGRPHFARGGVGDPERVEDALQEAARHARTIADGDSP